MKLTKQEQLALDELNAYLAGRNEKTNKESDKKWIAATARNQHPTWLENLRKNTKTKETHPEWHDKITKINRARREKYGQEYYDRLSESQKKRYAKLSEEEKQAISESAKNKWQDPEYKQKMMEYYNTPEYKVYIKNRSKEVAARPEMQAWYKEFNSSKPKDPEYMKRLQKGIDKRTASEDWIRKNCRPVKCPYGIFPIAKQAMLEYQKEHGGVITSIAVKIRGWLKSDKKPEWQYLTWEQYDEQSR
jgi:hypothetical protein